MLSTGEKEEAVNAYLTGVAAALTAFFVIGLHVGRRVRDTNDYYVAGRRAPVLLVTGSLIASFLSTGAFLGDTGEVYSGFFMGIVIVGVLQACGYVYGAGFFGRYLRRSEVKTLPEYFARRFSPRAGRLACLVLLFSVSAYLLSAMQGIATLLSQIAGLPYRSCIVLAWLAFTAFTIYSGSPGVLLTDTVMFLVFLAASLCALPFVAHAAGGWFPAIRVLAVQQELPGMLSWSGWNGYLYPDGTSNLLWAVTYGLVWALVVSVSPWQTSRYLMARDEHVILRSSVWASIGVMLVTVSLYFTAAFIRCVNAGLEGSGALIWAAMNLLPLALGVLLLTGIAAAGISSASTFLSLIGFSLVNDILPLDHLDDRRRLRLSRLAMLAVSLVLLLLSWFQPPQIFYIMYFGGTVIAASWSVPAFGSVWSSRLSGTGACLSMLFGLAGCVCAKFLYALRGVTPPVWADAFFVGLALSLFGAVIGSRVRGPGEHERAQRELLHASPESDPAEDARDRRLWLVYLFFALTVTLFFLFCYALPYRQAMEGIA